MSASADRVPAIITETQTIDRASLDDHARSVRTELERTIRPRSALGIWVEDEVDFAACILAALAVPADAFIVAPEASPTRVAELCEVEGASAVLCDEERALRLVDGARRACGPGLVLVETQPQPTARGHEEGSVHFFTSGTDGRPKGIVRTKPSLQLEESILGGHLGMAPGCTVLCAIPVIHGYGFTAGLFAPLSFGGISILARPRLAASLEKLLITYAPDIVVGVPAQYAAWSALRRPYTGPVPRVWLCGGAPLPRAVRSRFEAAWGGVIAEQYGMTECGAVTVDLDGAATLGRPYPGVSVSIDRGSAPGTVGEVVISTPYGPRGYLGDQAGGRTFTADGVRTGDSGWLDDDGRLHLVGRRAHQLNVRGKKVDPVEVERAFWALDGVLDVAVVGVDRATGDQWIAAYVVCLDSVTDDQLLGVSSHLESHQRPQWVTRLPELPKTPIGKTDFVKLRAMARSPAADG